MGPCGWRRPPNLPGGRGGWLHQQHHPQFTDCELEGLTLKHPQHIPTHFLFNFHVMCLFSRKKKKNTIFFFNGTCLHSVLFRLNVLNAPYSYLLHLFKGLQLSTNCPLLFNEVYKCKSQIKSVIWETKKPKQPNKIKRKPKIHTWKWNPMLI